LGHIEKSKQNREKQKTQAKPKQNKLLGECLVLTQKIVIFCFPWVFCFCFGSEMEKQKKLGFLFFQWI